MNANAPKCAGFYGKLPAHGDFVSRQLDKPMIDCWDHWLQSGMASSRVQLGSQWLECYLSAPIWRFGLATGLCGPARLGVMMPSIDRVGRYFPLTVTIDLHTDVCLWHAAICAKEWLAAIEAAMLNLLEEDEVTADEFAQRLAAMPFSMGTVTTSKTSPLQINNEGPFTRLSMVLPAGEVSAASNPLLSYFVQTYLGSFSLWWTEGSNYVPSCLRLYQGMPEAEQFWSMLDCLEPDDEQTAVPAPEFSISRPPAD